MSAPALSVVAPVWNEAAILPELARRCAAAAQATGLPYEIILVDDASTDETERLSPSLSRDGVRFLRLPGNRGQLGATLAGLASAAGEWVVVLDGDLQDPPEMIGALVDRIRQGNRVETVFAVKQRRSDAGWVRLGVALYHWLQRFGRTAPPAGAGSYCVLSLMLARKISVLPIQNANLSTLVAALGHPTATIPYVKEGRYDGRSRVGLRGLVREALGSLLLTGALERILLGGALALLSLGGVGVGWPIVGVGGLFAGGFLSCGWGMACFWRHRRLTPQQPGGWT